MDGRAEDAEIAGLQRLIDAPDRVLVLHGIHFGLSVVDATVIPHGCSIRPSDRLQKCHSRSESIPAPMLRSTKQAPADAVAEIIRCRPRVGADPGGS
jgi:hypothetical protein